MFGLVDEYERPEEFGIDLANQGYVNFPPKRVYERVVSLVACPNDETHRREALHAHVAGVVCPREHVEVFEYRVE